MAKKKFSTITNQKAAKENLKGMEYFFDSEWYLQAYPDVMKMVEEERCRSAFYHYIHIGAKEGYSPNPDFDEGYYIQANQDVKETVEKGDIRCGYHHFLVYGEMEGRMPRPISLEESDARQALIAIFNETNT